MLMVALTAREFSQSPYDYLFGSQLKLAIDYLAYTLIVEAQTEAQNKADAQNTPTTHPRRSLMVETAFSFLSTNLRECTMNKNT